MKEPRSRTIEQLAARMTEETDRELLEAGVIQEAERRWRSRSSRRRHRWVGVGIAAVVSAAAVGSWVTARKANPIELTVDGQHAEAGSWIEAGPGQESASSFSDGSSVLLMGGRLRVAELDDRGAVVELERGRLIASIHHGSASAWRFEIGPYAVHVIGTRFEAGWDPVRERFELRLEEGRVEVEGPRLPRRTLIAGQRLALEPEPAEAAGEPVPGPSLTEELAGHEAVETPAEPSSPQRLAPRPGRASGSWSTLESQGRYREALDAAEEEGFEQLASSLPAGDVLRLGDVARYAGRPERARVAYQKVRRRFRGTEPAASAAYALGLLEHSRSGSSAWFETYLRESPEGPLARESMGRLLEARRLAPDEGARVLAERYLQRFPEGPHGELARSILDR